MSGRSRSTSATVGTNSTARARADAPVYATRASPCPAACSNDARESAASTSSSTTNMRGIASRGTPLSCSLDCVFGCARTTVHSTKADGTQVLIARFETPDLPLGFLVRDAVGIFDLIAKTCAPARNDVEVNGREPPPVGEHFAPE